jgi:hypothetical protein
VGKGVGMEGGDEGWGEGGDEGVGGWRGWGWRVVQGGGDGGWG